MEKIYDIYVVGAREKFEGWIKNRGGVQVWNNLNLSNPGAGNMYTPALCEAEVPQENGGVNMVPGPKPHWSVGQGEVVTDIKRFRFAKGFKELKRIRVALKRGNGMNFCLTDASQREVDKALDAAREKFGDDVIYRKEGGLFDMGRFIVIELPEWEA